MDAKWTKKHGIAVALLFLVFVVFTLPYGNWGFDVDDCGNIFSSKFSSLNELVRLFMGIDFFSITQPSNYVLNGQSFFNVFYRPISQVINGIQYAFFGNNPYGYFVICAFFHVLNAALFYYILQFLFKSTFWPIWGALFFATHMSLWQWLGWISAQPYMIGLSLILISFMLFFLFLQTGKKRFLLGSLFSYLLALFLFELVIVYPVVLLILFCFFKPENLLLHKDSFGGYLKKINGFIIINLLFLGVRLYFFPIKFGGSDYGSSRVSLFSFIRDLSTRYSDLASFLADICNVSFTPEGYFFIKAPLIGFVCLSFCYLFFNSRKKLQLIMLVLSGMTFMWPAVLRHYVLRYLYFGLPFFIVVMIFLFSDYETSKKKTFKILRGFLVLILVGNLFHVSRAMKRREAPLHIIRLALDDLATDSRILHRPLCFFGLPKDYFRTSLAQAVWMYGTTDMPIYFDVSTFTLGNKCFENQIDIQVTKEGLSLKSRDSSLCWWVGFGGEFMRMGKKIFLIEESSGKVIEIEYELDKKYLEENLLFITWDYEKNKFKILDYPNTDESLLSR